MVILISNYIVIISHSNTISGPEAAGNVNILLSEKKTNFEAYTDLGWSPLLLAAEAGSYHAVCSLIKAGAEVNNSDMSCGRTVLHIAVEGGHKNIVEFLLKNVRLNLIEDISFFM
jgi:ankyrin repeat protein